MFNRLTARMSNDYEAIKCFKFIDYHYYYWHCNNSVANGFWPLRRRQLSITFYGANEFNLLINHCILYIFLWTIEKKECHHIILRSIHLTHFCEVSVFCSVIVKLYYVCFFLFDDRACVVWTCGLNFSISVALNDYKFFDYQMKNLYTNINISENLFYLLPLNRKVSS